MKWSPQQEAIFDWFAKGSGNQVVRARAGCAKTTSAVKALSLAPENDILMAAFGNKIAKELGRKVQEVGGDNRAEIKTLHGVGYGIVRRYWDGVGLHKTRGFDLARRVAGEQCPDEMITKIQKLAGIAKGMVTSFNPESEELFSDMVDMAIKFDVEPDAEWQQDGWTTERVAKYAIESMELARRRPENGQPKQVDFNDMLFLPIANDWAQPRYDLVVIDEAQDMSAVQLELAQRVMRPGGRASVIGDDRQAIFGFRGADSGSLDRLKRELSAVEFGLTKTYRCGKVIVDYARKLVPDFQADDSNPLGEINAIPLGKLVETAVEGDFILSRKNAPLAVICLRLIRAGKRARIEGKDIGASLKSICKRWKPKNMAQLQDNINRWHDREIARLSLLKSREAADKMALVADQAEILLAICDSITGPEQMLPKLETLFVDSEDDPRPSIVCSSIHKAKGLEANRVFVLRYTLYPKRFVRRGEVAPPENEAQKREEANLEYVAVTRARNVLTWVSE